MIYSNKSRLKPKTRLGVFVNKKDFPKIHFYDQDFVDIYNKTWSWVSSLWINPETGEQDSEGLFIYPEKDKLKIGRAHV